MKKSRYTEEQIIGILKQAEAGISIKDLCRKGGFSDATFYKWRTRFGGLEVAGWPTRSGCVSWSRRTPSSSGCWPRCIWTCMR